MRALGQESSQSLVKAQTFCQARMWDNAAFWWAEHLKNDKNRNLQIFPTVIRLIGEIRDRHILDAGCGEGSFARVLAGNGATVMGIDFSRLLDLAVAKEDQDPRGINYHKGDLNSLLLGRSAFDCIVCNLVFHCFSDLSPVLNNLHYQLKPGGALVISELHPETFPLYSKPWTSCRAMEGNEYRYALSSECPELTLYLHDLKGLEESFREAGFICQERLSPPAPCPDHLEPPLPQFVYYRLLRK